jgi:Cu/Ag efflux protein CusF
MKQEFRQSGLHSFLALALFLAATTIPSDQILAHERLPAATPKIFHGVGAITGIDAASGVVSIDHEEIPGLMSAMEMEYQARPEKILDGLKLGDKVEFDVDGKTLTVLGIRKRDPAK